ncbi:hypothetical protein ACFLWR_00195 [Chloroflexota bacterium]
MTPRQRKPAVSMEKAMEWLERYNRGESPPEIARADGYDQRTVRKYLDIAGREREAREARGTVLRSALERHYADLCKYAERLGEEASGGHGEEFDKSFSSGTRYEPQLGAALREHLPRSPIWGYLKRIEKLNTNKSELAGQLGSTIEAGISSDSYLKSQLANEETSVVTGLIDALKAQAELWAQGSPGLNVTDNLRIEPPDEDFVNVHYGPFNMGRVSKEHVGVVRKAIIDWTSLVKEKEEYRGIERAVRELERIEEKLRDEIAVIVLRRVLPGRCKYCPL